MIRPRMFGMAVGSLFALAAAAAAADETACLRTSGHAATRCLTGYLATIDACRLAGNPACEAAARASGGAVAELLDVTGVEASRSCEEADAEALGNFGTDDLTARIPQACADVAEALLDLTWGAPPAAPGPLSCRREVLRQRQRLVASAARTAGVNCFLAATGGRSCDRARRDDREERVRRWAARAIARRCGSAFDTLGLGTGTSTDARVAGLIDTVAERARFFVKRVYPSPLLGPTAAAGPFPVGVRTIDLVDPARANVGGTGPRPVRVEIYYPSTAGAVAGVPRDVAQVFGIDVAKTPAYRDVARAPGRFPLVLFSHGNGGIRFQSLFLAAHLASHGFVLASPDHHGNTFVDGLAGLVDVQAAINRPLDMRFLLDQLLASDADADSFLAGGIDADRVGMSGHSFGGYTAFAIGGGPFALGTFTDPRVRALLPLAPAAPGVFDDAFFASLSLPTLIMGGSLDVTTPFVTQQERPFALLPSGAPVVGLAELMGAGHFSFSDICEVPRSLVGFIGGFNEACEPLHLPWRWAHRLVSHLALNFFRATLLDDPTARAQLSAATLGGIDDLVYREK